MCANYLEFDVDDVEIDQIVEAYREVEAVDRLLLINQLVRRGNEYRLEGTARGVEDSARG